MIREIMHESSRVTRIPLLPLPDLVHFPRTTLKIHISEPRYRRLVADLTARSEELLIGTVLIKPGWERAYAGHPAIFPGGTMARLVDVEMFPDGRSTIVLEGEHRFEIRREVGEGPYREALVVPIEEPLLNERDAGIQAVRRDLVATVQELAEELADAFPLGEQELEELDTATSFEELVNGISAELDMPALRKLELLCEALPDRALDLLGILRTKKEMIDLLRPYRRLDQNAELN